MVKPLLVVLVALVLAYIFSEGAKRLRLPRVIGHLAAGFALSLPLIKERLFTLENSAIFSFFADMGLILLFYFIGLEINLHALKKEWKISSLVALFVTAIPLGLGFVVMRYVFDLPVVAAAIVGLALSVSAVGVSADILEELRLLKTRIASLIIGAGAVGDIVQFSLLAVLLVFVHMSEQSSILYLIGGVLAFLALVVVLRFVIVPFAIRQFERQHSQTGMFMGSLIIVMLIAYLAEVFRIGSLIGALIAGMIVRQVLLNPKEHKPWEEHALAKSIHVISFGLLVPLFFVWIGVNTSFSGVVENLGLIVTMIVLNIGSALVGAIAGVVAGGGSVREGVVVGWGTLPKGDAELIIATLGISAGLISSEVFSAIVVGAFVVTIIATVVFTVIVKKERRMLLG